MKKLMLVVAVVCVFLAGCAALTALSQIDATVSVPTSNGNVTISSGDSDTSGTVTVVYKKDGSDAVTTLSINTSSNIVSVASTEFTSNTLSATFAIPNSVATTTTQEVAQ
jgi:hypothetical protein